MRNNVLRNIGTHWIAQFPRLLHKIHRRAGRGTHSRVSICDALGKPVVVSRA
jgi:hypothetical protein